MEKLNEIIVVLKKLSEDGKGWYLENIIVLCNKDYNIKRVDISKVNKGVDLKIIKKQKSGKMSYSINKDVIKESKVRKNRGDIWGWWYINLCRQDVWGSQI